MVFKVSVDECVKYDVDVEAESKAQAEAIARSACDRHDLDLFTENRWVRVKVRYEVR